MPSTGPQHGQPERVSSSLGTITEKASLGLSEESTAPVSRGESLVPRFTASLGNRPPSTAKPRYRVQPSRLLDFRGKSLGLSSHRETRQQRARPPLAGFRPTRRPPSPTEATAPSRRSCTDRVSSPARCERQEGLRRLSPCIHRTWARRKRGGHYAKSHLRIWEKKKKRL